MKRGQLMIIVAAVLLSLLLVACGLKPSATEITPAPKAVTPAVTTKLAWEEDWQTTLNAASQEGNVTVYSSYATTEWRQNTSNVMKERYGITLDVLVGRSADVIERLIVEQTRRLYNVDVAMTLSPANFLNQALPAGVAFQSVERMLILPEVIDPKVWRGGELAWFDRDTKSFLFFRQTVGQSLLVNTDLVAPQEMKRWRDLLNPKWKGRMVLNDPTISGSGRTQLSSVLAYGMKDWDFINELLKQEPIIIRDARLQVEWIARGRYPIAIGPRKEESMEFVKLGAPVKFVNFPEGAAAAKGSGVTVLKSSPHPNAAKVFVNFFLSKEGQTIFSKTVGIPSLRVDVPTDDVEPDILPQPGVKYFNNEDPGYLAEVQEINRKLDALVTPLLK